tara:strand:- start:328 stop:822 length:495 start_codon:yes stop_codon:yes gene_type:complete
MTIILKNKHTLQIEDFYFRCCVGKNGVYKKKKEGDKKTPKGIFGIGNLYYRKDRVKKPQTSLKKIEITKKMGWCDDPSDTKNYNKLVKIPIKSKFEKLYRKDHKYDLIIPIKYNFDKIINGFGSCIFLHITKNYHPTAGCIAISQKDFLIMLRLINKKTKIEIL